MIFELLHVPFPDGYGEGLLPLEQCKRHLRITSDDEDELIQVLRDAAIEFVEQYCGVRLAPMTGLQWQAQRFPVAASVPLPLSVAPVTAITSVSWLDTDGGEVTGSPDDYRVTSRGDVLPAISSRWPSAVGGMVKIEFEAGYPSGSAPKSLLMAAKMFLGHLWMHREAVIDSGSMGEVPFGVRQLCAPFSRVLI
ncbi:phage head-tail connector protein [Novosphingobium profundi]|uniref:head-tail connector protein n=1 Tax=Novosphingobium profundi TaxID=1774954 RepID=UPI001BDAD874|nr:head-tail connector protein [Novosphingobium profundi]MBT0667072.1 phage head-tail connector protein [Novosphingobium profundi]